MYGNTIPEKHFILYCIFVNIYIFTKIQYINCHKTPNHKDQIVRNSKNTSVMHSVQRSRDCNIFRFQKG